MFRFNRAFLIIFHKCLQTEYYTSVISVHRTKRKISLWSNSYGAYRVGSHSLHYSLHDDDAGTVDQQYAVYKFTFYTQNLLVRSGRSRKRDKNSLSHDVFRDTKKKKKKRKHNNISIENPNSSQTRTFRYGSYAIPSSALRACVRIFHPNVLRTSSRWSECLLGNVL